MSSSGTTYCTVAGPEWKKKSHLISNCKNQGKQRWCLMIFFPFAKMGKTGGEVQNDREKCNSSVLRSLTVDAA